MRVDRVLLIGSAAASRPFREIAPGLFRAPFLVPRPAEYVGVGAARQAAWALSGAAEPPGWELVVDSTFEVPAGDTADVLGRYSALLAQLHSR